MRGILSQAYLELWLRRFEYEPLLERYHLRFIFFTICACYTVLEVFVFRRLSTTGDHPTPSLYTKQQCDCAET